MSRKWQYIDIHVVEYGLYFLVVQHGVDHVYFMFEVNNEPLSLAKAKKEGLKMAKLPLDKYLQWGSGSGKSLTLNQVVSILNDVKFEGNWKNALRHVPKRKLKEFTKDYNTNRTDKKLNRSCIRQAWIPSFNNKYKSMF